jgi:hypothetical protein
MSRSGRITLVPAAAMAALATAVSIYCLWASRSGAADPDRVGYPPLAKPIDTELWIVGPLRASRV